MISFINYYFKENKDYKLFVDMDGVLCDFNKAWKDLDVTDKDFGDYEEEVGRAYAECKEGKKIWVKEELGDDIPLIFSRTKGKHAFKNGILIDDYDEKIDNWEDNGGIGIVHKSAKETIKRLKKLGL
ncbi:MAG: hypothetical protein QXG00_07225 [Candidatus Woesearchaeota archaeon]